MPIAKKACRYTYAPKKRAELDLTLSENPLGPSPKAIQAIIDASQTVHQYPNEDELVDLLSQHHNISKERILLGAGANQLLEELLTIYALGKTIIVPTATFPESVGCMPKIKGSVKRIPLHIDFSLDLKGLLNALEPNTACIHLCNPNNPTGIWTDQNLLKELACQSSVPLIISEAGIDFVSGVRKDDFSSNTIVVRSLSKSYGLAGLRIGYCIASSEIIEELKLSMRSYRICSLALVGAVAALQDQDHLRRSIDYIQAEKAWLMKEMSALGFSIIPSQGQTFIAKVPKAIGTANQFCQLASAYGVAVVNCSLYEGMDAYIRISPQRREINQKYISKLNVIIRGK